MRAIFDTDGTFTDFNKFIKEEGIPFFEKEYGMTVVYPDKLEIEDILDMDNFFMRELDCTKEEAQQFTKSALDDFWVHPRYLKYSLLYKFRQGLVDYTKELKKGNNEIDIYTSRAKTTDDNVIGKVARSITRLQYMLNGINLPSNNFHYFKNDEEKIAAIIAANPDIVFEDKPEVIKVLNDAGIKVICPSGWHNTEVEDNRRNVFRSNCDTLEDVLECEKNVLGARKVEFFRRAAKSDAFYQKLVCLKGLLLNYFEPIILHGENIKVDENKALIYAPNHRSTLDPLAINAVINKHVHWVALLRFFQGKDSIFNNSKNPFLCKLTADTFKKLDYIPVDRKSDNPEAKNLTAVRDMIGYLGVNKIVGIFPEGTTRRPEGQEFGTFDPSFTLLAKKQKADIMPVTTYWFRDKKNKKRVVLNFGKAISPEGKTQEEIYNEFLAVQEEQLRENKVASEYYLENKNSKKRILKSSKVYYN